VPSFRRATVTELLSERRGLQRVRLGEERAYVLTQLTGSVAVGDDVIVNTTAVDLGLGTGGWHVVHWNLAHDAWSEPGPGHIMKLRYTSLQVDAGAAEELADEPDDAVDEGLAGTPVVVCSLHSQLPGVAATVKAIDPSLRVSYVMTDGAALPLAFSDLVVALADRGLVDGTLTAGHAFGGDLEAVTVASALSLARRRQHADVVVVAMGPGVVGTGTRLGTTALEVATIADTAAWLGGQPVVCPRLSDADARPRHRGISHHTLTALDAVRSTVRVALPERSEPWVVDVGEPAPVLDVVATPDVGALLAGHDLRVTTMGRGPDQEPSFFAACGAAGVVATRLARSRA
jgi:hypothetical protein